MKVATTDDIHYLMAAYIDSAALGAALESGLFWGLAEQPQSADGVAHCLSIPLNRCRYWLDLLVSLGLLERDGEIYSPSRTTRAAILEVYSRETWTYLAQEWRERFPVAQDLALHIHDPGSVWDALGLAPPRYLAQLEENPERARHFTRMLYELHRPMADELAGVLDLAGVLRLLDLGGGSGVMSLALLRHYPQLASVVVDIENVCIVGREIAAEHRMEDRITHYAADFLREDLPGEFDMVLECDVGIYEAALFQKLWVALKAGGRLVIVDQFAPAKDVAPVARPYLHWAFLGSLSNADSAFPTAAEVKTRLTQAGFRILSEATVSDGWLVIEAGK